ncbi:multicopper oxidase domain-containing protein [Leptothrix discophora]|uniref:Multicopper oxidase domain-containing protein n=1 Tax=Leptothrix discophora TaxID=89 RepID=A0ABT9G059_LEPDI|nr:multicopper oxidase domain-containing protein [Leptothrix discophora]MDP4299864.1 multicopper oxidase domain-containing protein [Leptothrix discophora]
MNETKMPEPSVTATPRRRGAALPAWTRRGAYVLGALGAASLSVAVTAQVAVDYWGDPPDTDTSAYVEPAIGPVANDALKTAEHTNHSSFEGTANDAKADVFVETSVPLTAQTGNAIPTGGRPSPLFSATDWSFPLLMFEEFAPQKLDATVDTSNYKGFPAPTLGPAPAQHPTKITRSAPSASAIESFLGQPGIKPYPANHANTFDRNPWNAVASEFIGRTIDGPAEGRPPGEGWAHQRWNEFFPQTYFQTVQGTSRVNLGVRDKWQRHGYQDGTEFGPNGLYAKPAGPTGKTGTTNGIDVRFHPGLPAQHAGSVWTFDGTMPPKLLQVRYGEGVVMRHYNGLPVDPAANKGFGLHTISTHQHNGHNPAESDGVAQAFFFPGQFYDYHWPIQLAGYDTINTGATDPRAGYPCVPGETLYVNDAAAGAKTCPADGVIRIRGDWRETASTLWFHDHMLDFTAQNVYKGNAAMMNLYSAIDRGNESFNCHYNDPVAADPTKVPKNVNLCLPSGNKLSWGNRDYDINLVISDKAWDRQGQLWFNVFNKNGFLGDRLLTNFVYHPYLDVRNRRYRFRILNGGVSRYLSVALVKQIPKGSKTPGEFAGVNGVTYTAIPFHMIGNDGNLMEHAIAFDGKADLDGNGNASEHKGTLPQQAIAERYDIVVDFSKNGVVPGDKLYFVNLQEHASPEKTSRRVALADVLSGRYKPTTKDDNGDGVADRWVNGDPAVGQFMELRVKPMAAGQVDTSMDPAKYVEGKLKMIPLKLDRTSKIDYAEKLKNAKHRTFSFGHSGGTDDQPWTVKTDGGDGYNADMRRISAAPKLSVNPTAGGSVQSDSPYEIWYLELGGGWDHPVHIHFEEGIILRRNGKLPPAWEKYARKDVYRIGGDLHAGSSVEIALQFREFAGTFVEHCHATQHEDNAMLLRWDIERAGQTLAMPTPMPTWDGVHYTGSAALTTFRSGLGTGPTYTLP